MARSVFCIVHNRTQAERIVDDLKAAGFSNNDISVLFPDKTGTRDFAHEQNTKAPEGAMAGGATGLAVGGVLGPHPLVVELVVRRYRALAARPEAGRITTTAA